MIATPLNNIKARYIAEKLIDNVFTKFGVPAVVTSDKGTQFTGEIFSDLAEMMGFTHWPTVPYHQSANGQCERMNGTIITMLKCYEKDKNSNDLQMLVHAYNNTVNSTTGETPFYLTHGFDPLTPVDVALNVELHAIQSDVSLYKQELAEKIKRAWDTAHNMIVKSQYSYKSQYDKRNNVKKSKLKIGDVVLRKVELSHGKLSEKWEGPYRIINVAYPNVSLDYKGKVITTHLDKVKEYKMPFTLPLRPITVQQKLQHPGDKNLEMSDEE